VGGLAASNVSAFAQLASLSSAVSGLAASNASAFGALASLGVSVGGLSATTLSLSSTLAPLAAQYQLPFTYSAVNGGGVNVYSLNAPQGGISLDSSGGVYMADSGNNRVLHYLNVSTMATTVLGQGGSFSSAVLNIGSIVSASGLSNPTGVASGASGGVYVLDTGNHRMLYFASGASVATRVYGQGGTFVTGVCNKNGTTAATTLCSPYAVVLDSNNKPYIADYGLIQLQRRRMLAFALFAPD